eukprot:2485699-Rhodomonas_salina.1
MQKGKDTDADLKGTTFPLCSRAWTMKDLEILNESRTMYSVIDFTPGEEQIGVWANRAYLDMTNQTLEKFLDNIKASKISVTVATLNSKLYQNIQVDNNCERISKVLYPNGKPMTFEFHSRPFKLIRH